MLRTRLILLPALATIAAAAACGGGQARMEDTAPSVDTPVPSASVTTSSVDRSRTWTWGQRVSRGACVMDDARVTLYDDGTYQFHSLVQSRDANDRWEVTFEFLDRDRVLLEGLQTNPMQYTMENANQRYRWISERRNQSGQPLDANTSRGMRLNDIQVVNIRATC